MVAPNIFKTRNNWNVIIMKQKKKTHRFERNETGYHKHAVVCNFFTDRNQSVIIKINRHEKKNY